MKKFLTIFFVSLGVIFFIILLALAYLWFADPFEIRPLIERYQSVSTVDKDSVSKASSDQAVVNNSETEDVPAKAQNSPLSSNQAEALSAVGIDESLVTSFSQEEIECFTRILGAERVEEIKKGAVPSPGEFFAAKECLN
jgi:hypothetical protein